MKKRLIAVLIASTLLVSGFSTRAAEEAIIIPESELTLTDNNTWEEPEAEGTSESWGEETEETEESWGSPDTTESSSESEFTEPVTEVVEPVTEATMEEESESEQLPETEMMPRSWNASAISMFAAAVTLTGKYDDKGHGQEWDSEGFCQHLDTVHTNGVKAQGSGSAPHTGLTYNNVFMSGNSSLGYNAFLRANALGRSSSAVSYWSLATPAAADRSFWYGQQFFQWNDSQKADVYDSSASKLSAIYPNAVGYYDRTTGSLRYYDLRLTLEKFRKTVGRKKVNGGYERDVKTAQFKWCPSYPGIATIGIDYADIKFEVLNPGTTTVASITGFKGFTQIKDVDWWQGIAFKTSDRLAYGTYQTGDKCICASNIGDYTYLHSTSGGDMHGDKEIESHIGIEFRNGTVFRVVLAQGKFSQNARNKLETTFGGEATLPQIPANVTLKKYASTNSDVTEGLGSNPTLALPYYCYDTFYYRVNAKFNDAYFNGGKLTDEFPEWLAVNGVNVYQKVNGSWKRVVRQVAGVSTTYGQKKTVTVNLGSTADLRGQEYCIEYEVKLPTASVFASLAKKPTLQSSKYKWTNTASLAYNYKLGGVATSGTLTASVDVTMPQGQEPSIRKYVGNRGAVSSTSISKTLTKGCGDTFSYFLDIKGVQPNMLYEPLVVTDTLPPWLVYEGASTYYKSGTSWYSTSCWSTGCTDNKFTATALNNSSLAKGTEHLIEIKVRVVDTLAFYKLSQKPSYNSTTKRYYWDNTASLAAVGSSFTSNRVTVYMPEPNGLFVLAHKYDADTGNEIKHGSLGGSSVFRVYEYSAASGDFQPYSDFQLYIDSYGISLGYVSKIPLLRTTDNQGKFYVKEVNAPINYALNTEWQFDINLSDYEGSNKPSDNIIKIDGSDACRDKRSERIIFRKCYKDPNTGEDVPIPGVNFLFRNDIDYRAQSVTTDDDGYVIPRVDIMAAGTVRVSESCSIPGFPEVDGIEIGNLNNQLPRYISWNSYDMSDYGITTTSKVENDVTIVTVYNTPNTLKVYKVGKGSFARLAGAEMSILDAKGNVVRSFTTDDNGSYTVVGLPFGEYTLREDKAPEGYLIADQIGFTYSISKQAIIMYDEPMQTFDLTVKKRVRASDMWAAHGDQFFMFDVDGTDQLGEHHHYTKTWHNTGEVRLSNGWIEGTIVFKDIPMGNYTVSERRAFPYYGYASVTGCDYENLDPLETGMMFSGDPLSNEKVLIKPTADKKSPVVTFENYKDTWDDYRDTDFVQNVIPIE